VRENGFSTSAEVVGWIRFFLGRPEVPSILLNPAFFEILRNVIPNRQMPGMGYSHSMQNKFLRLFPALFLMLAIAWPFAGPGQLPMGGPLRRNSLPRTKGM